MRNTIDPDCSQTFEFCRARIDLNDSIKIVQQFDDNGRHRLILGVLAGEWAGYQHISVLNIPRVGMFRGTSDYYGVTLPRVFQMILSFTEATSRRDR